MSSRGCSSCVQELEAFRGQLEATGALDTVWRELQDDRSRRPGAAPRHCPLLLAAQPAPGSAMPYDSNRVVLRSGKDDYINASRVGGALTLLPALVATQAPAWHSSRLLAHGT